MEIDTSLVRRLVAAQFPRWSHLPVRPVAFGGWDNRTFHLGGDMTARLPSAAAYALQVEKEHRWLPRLAPRLPLPIPTPLAMGMPAADYPWHWSVYRWIAGDTATVERIGDLSGFATTLAKFLLALRRVDVVDGPPPSSHNFFRGGSLRIYDADTRQAINFLRAKIDAAAATAIWEDALAAVWRGPPVWLHGDVNHDNLLVESGRLSAVIDFGCAGVGDPACDLSIAWTLFSGESREAFRAAVRVDDATWARGRGWTLWKALITLAGDMTADGSRASRVKHVLDQVLADHANAAR